MRVFGTVPARPLGAGSFALLLVLVVGSFGGGWYCSRHVTLILPYAALANMPRAHPGDAPAPLRTQVLEALAELQQGYTRRDLKQLPDWMHHLFAPDLDVIALGTGATEWVSSYDQVEQFFWGDWANWGNVRLAVDSARVSASGNVAWVATTGVVSFPRGSRPLRFTAVMSRSTDHWVFRQIQFQWDDPTVQFSDLLRPGNFRRLRLN
jgi:hypothetical protein